MISLPSPLSPFSVAAFFLLGIERVLYAFWYCYPNKFKASVRNGTFGKSAQEEPLYWKSAMTLGKYIKVFQFSVIAYDLISRCDIDFGTDKLPQMCIGIALILLGQFLNVAVFNALGAIGVYYGYEFGYDVPMVSCFPYNVSWISDPQYWGVVLTVWGLYISFGFPHTQWEVPILETFWYVMSMKVFEHPRGRAASRYIFGDDKVVKSL